MDTHKKLGFLRQNIIFYLIGFALIFGMKYLYSKASCDDLRWILGPTARWVEVLTDIPFCYEPGMGYANHSLRFLIAPSCSGVQFLIITAAMLIFSFSHRVGGQPVEAFSEQMCADFSAQSSIQKTRPRIPQIVLKPGWIVLSLLLSYVFTVFVNGLRIVVAIYLPSLLEQSGAFSGLLTPHSLHTMIGAVVYFAALLTIYRLTGLVFDRFQGAKKDRPSAFILGKCLSPLFWYFFIVLGIPFLNRTWHGGNAGFTDFALLVTFCCGLVLLLYGTLWGICRRIRKHS